MIVNRRARLLLVTLGFLRLEGQLPPVLLTLHRWLDTWRGIGHRAVGMARQGYDLQLTRYDEKGWRATFYTTGMEHSRTSDGHRMGAHAVARDAAGGVGGARERRPRLVMRLAALSA